MPGGLVQIFHVTCPDCGQELESVTNLVIVCPNEFCNYQSYTENPLNPIAGDTPQYGAKGGFAVGGLSNLS